MWENENHPDDEFSFCICPPFDQQPATAGNGTMFAFRADNAKIVRRFHAAGLRAGGKDEGVLGTRTAYGHDFYVAYLRDPDGHKLACFYRNYSPDADTLRRGRVT